MTSIAGLSAWLMTYPLSYVSISLSLDVKDSNRPLDRVSQVLETAACPVLDISLTCSPHASNLGILELLFRSKKVAAVGFKVLGSDMDAELIPHILQMFEESKNAAHLCRLKFHISPAISKRNGSRLAQAVARLIQHDKALLYLDTSDSGIDFSLSSLVESKFLDALKLSNSLCYLRIRGVGMDADGAMLLSRTMASQRTVELLDISQNPVGNKGVCALAECLKRNTTLRFLILCSCDVSEHGACALANALEVNTRLDLLFLKDDDLGAPSGQAFAAMLKVNKTLRRLHLDYCDLKPEGCRPFVEALSKNRTLKHLGLVHSGIGYHDRMKLIEVAKNGRTLEILYVEDRNELSKVVQSQPRYTLLGSFAYIYAFETNFAQHLRARSRRHLQQPPVAVA